MLTIGTRIRIVAFVVIAFSVIGYIATTYADLGRHIGLRDDYSVKLHLAETGGLFEGSAVSYRGVTVGKVGGLHLSGDGVVAELRIEKSAPRIPQNLKATVANRSAVGEQYVDLRPESGAGPYLADGGTIPRQVTSTPAPVSETLTSVNDLAASVPLEDLRTVINELGLAFQGQGPHLQALLDAGDRFITAADANLDATTSLIDNGEVVLRTQNQEAGSLKSFARDSRLLARRLLESDTDLRKLIIAAPRASTQLAGLLRDLDPSLSVLLANLLTNSRLTAPRLAGLEELLLKLPQVAAMGSTVVSSGRLNLGLINTFFNPLPCVRGYGGTAYRNGLDVSPGASFNTGARCDLPASTGVDVRGSANAPHKGVPDPARPGSVGPVGTDGGLPGALGLPPLPAGPETMSQLLGLNGAQR